MAVMPPTRSEVQAHTWERGKTPALFALAPAFGKYHDLNFREGKGHVDITGGIGVTHVSYLEAVLAHTRGYEGEE